ncbi:hypothetical protein IW16_04190 [Chryseobacterium vrystaatense]|uniref:Uncharacterized protein n=1 Tax=Chryseobacterium vrystaatense TaxID=307480 RepID=A0ABR4UT73_9FLAO|nr:hypothetical protein IW16_04190 [Chryseobacterium vrystaatense]
MTIIIKKMIQLIFLMFGISLSTHFDHTTAVHNNKTSISENIQPESMDTGGNTIQVPPKK